MLLTENNNCKNVLEQPFPHVVVEEALDKELLDQIFRSIPDLKSLTDGKRYGNNERFNYSASDILANPDIAPEFKELARIHLSQAFLKGVVNLFGKFIPEYFPDFKNRFGDLYNLRAGVRGKDNERDEIDVLMDFQLASNTPVFLPGTTVRAPHIDCPKKLFVGLLYLRHPEDDSTGGDLELYTPSAEASASGPKMDITRTARKEDMAVAKTIPYKSNSLVLFLNTPHSYHGVTVRKRTGHVRLFLNLLGEMKEPLFDLSLEKTGSRKVDLLR